MAKPGILEAPGHLRHRERAERQREAVDVARAAAPLDVLLVEDGQLAPAILAHRFDQRHGRLRVLAAGQAGAAPVFAPARQVGHEVEPEEAAAPEHARRPTRAWPRDRVSRVSDCRMPYGAITRPKPSPRPERQVTDVAADEERAIGEPRARQPRPRPRQHRRREIDPDELRARLDDRERDAAGAAAELEHGSVVGERQPLPEGDVAPRDGLRVLPVVERRVLRPSRPSRAAPSSMPRLHPVDLRALPSLPPLPDRRKQHRVLDLDERRSRR